MDEKLHAILNPIFRKFASTRSGELGDPHGELAYAYIRVSTAGQAEEGRSGLPRQLEHIHEKARQSFLRVSYSLLFADDHTGFEFQNRPDLQRLISEVSRPNRAASHLLIENIDRLSRNAKWHQGYLLDLFERQSVSVHFWKAFSSEIERAVMGAISEQGMRNEIERMKQGMRHKAESGRITARRPTFGYKFVDSRGRPATDPASEFRQDSHYVLDEDKAPVMQELFYRIVGGESLNDVCNDFEERKVPTPKLAKHWATGNVSRMLKNPTYKGEYVANRFYFQEEWSERSQKMVLRQRQRPKEEWIIIPVPPLVSPQIWDEAQEAMKRNLRSSKRNAKVECLMQGFLYCAHCGHLFRHGGVTGSSSKGKKARRFYICGSYHGNRVVRQHLYCKSPYVYTETLDPHVWNTVCQLANDPDILINLIDEEHDKFKRGELNDQLKYIDRQIKNCRVEEQQWDKAYAAKIFSLEEYKEKRAAVQSRINALEAEWEKVSEEVAILKIVEQKRELIYEKFKMLKEVGFTPDMPFAEKRKMMAMLIDKVVIDSKNGWYRLEGSVQGTYQYEIKNNPEDENPSSTSSNITYTSAP
ncbi:MAG: recombinase family protein [Anaerolineae bacterium]|nr:recombinase family protein [Anaerolineae bacterium]